MDYQEIVARAKQAIIESDPTVTADDLDQFWAGGVMEIQRILFRHKEKDILYMVEANTMTETFVAKKYLPQV